MQGNQPPRFQRPGQHNENPQFLALQKRLQARYGAFGVESKEPEPPPDPFLDNYFRETLRILGAVLLGSFAVAVLGKNGNYLFALGLAYALFRITKKPIHIAARFFLVLALFIESPVEFPGEYVGVLPFGHAPLDPANSAFFLIPSVSMPIFLLFAFWLLYTGRQVNKKYDPPPFWAKRVLYIFLAGVITLWVWGILGGGDFTKSILQTRHLLMLPIIGLAFLWTMRGREDLAATGTIFVTVALVRSVILILSFAWFVKSGFTPEYVTTHSDTVLFVTAILILIAHAIEERNRKTTLRAIGIALVILVAIAMNNRRIAFVGLGAAPLVMYFALKPSAGKRRVTKWMLIVVPLVAAYATIGSTMTGPVFTPAKMAMSAFNQSDASSDSRDIENDNLILTFGHNPVLGKGFGFPYEEKVKIYDISDFLQDYLYIAHNGVLWIWSIGGMLGFAALWLIYPVSATFAMRAYNKAQNGLERAAGLSALGTTVVCVVQVWGDQGFNSYLTLVVFGAAFGVAAKLEAEPEEGQNAAP